MIYPPEEREMYYGTVEKRCEHLEVMVKSTAELLQVVVMDFESPTLKPIFGALVERINSIAAFLEAGLDSAPNLDKY